MILSGRNVGKVGTVISIDKRKDEVNVQIDNELITAGQDDVACVLIN
jgi:ribosomal protein L24